MINNNKRPLFQRELILIFISAAILMFASNVEADDGLRGPAFSDPSKMMDMSPEWRNKQIKYRAEAGNADLVVDLNQQLYPFLKPLVEEFARKSNLKIVITEGTCGKSAGKISRKEVDIGGFCCPPAEMDRLPGLKYHTLGITPLVLLVNSKNSVNNVTLEQARQIYQGNITKWSELGGSNSSIRTTGSLHCAKRPGHWRLLLDNGELFGVQFTPVGEMADNIAIVVNDPDAISYETIHVARKFQSELLWKALKIDGFHPVKLENSLNGDYPLYRVFNVTTWEGNNIKNPQAGDLVSFLMTKIESIESQSGLVPYTKLRKAGWRFSGNELVGEPE